MSRPTGRPFLAAALLSICFLCLGAGLAATTTANETYAIRLRVEPVRVKKNDTAELTAIVEPVNTCARRAVLFQVQKGGAWDTLGKKVDVDSSCHVSRKVTVKTQSDYRVLLLDPKKSTPLVTSPSVTVKVK